MKFKVFTVLEVDEEENILPVDEESHTESIQELIESLIYDIDGMKIKNIKVSNYE